MMNKTGFLIFLFLWVGPQASLFADTLDEARQLATNSDQLLSKLEEASQKGDAMKAKALGTLYSQTVSNAEQDIQSLRAQGKNDEAAKVEETISQSASKHQQVLERVRDRVPEQARFGIDRALQASNRGGKTAPGMASERSRQETGGVSPVQVERQTSAGGQGQSPFAGGSQGKGKGVRGKRPF